MSLPKLDAREARLLGVLIEKALSTPDHYPLTINAATAGANQKSNRSQVMDLSDSEVHDVLARLVIAGLAGRVLPAGSRVEKYRHNADVLLKLEKQALAVLAELLLRGPQSPAELKTRTSRMATLESTEVVGQVLRELVTAGHVVQITGSRTERYRQCLTEASDEAPAPGAPQSKLQPSSPTPQGTNELAELRAEVKALRGALAELARRLGEEDLVQALDGEERE